MEIVEGLGFIFDDVPKETLSFPNTIFPQVTLTPVVRGKNASAI